MNKIIVSTPKKARMKLAKMKGEMDEFLQRKQEHEVMKNMPKELSFTDHLASRGIPSDWSTRRVMAEKFGIKDYAGTSSQHEKMLAIMKGNQMNGRPE